MLTTQTGHRIISLLLALLLVLSLSPAALATGSGDDREPIAIDNEGNKYYTAETAWNAFKDGNAVSVTMLSDWVIKSRLVLNNKTSAAIYMNGYAIRMEENFRDNGEIFLMCEGSNLWLQGCDRAGSDVKKKLTYTDVSGNSTETKETGGLITGGRTYTCGGGIVMNEGATLTLDNVTIAGNVVEADPSAINANSSIAGGGICMAGNGGCVWMKNGASIERNWTESYGGGIYIDGTGCTVNLAGDSRIYSNQSVLGGGGIYSNCEGTRIYLKGGSTIDSNLAEHDGGGVYFNDTGFTLTSEDGTGKVINNWANNSDGGAVYADPVTSSSASEISNLKMWNNKATDDGGAIYLNQEDTTVKNCVLTENVAYSEGGGIYIDNDDCVIDSCTIQRNTATDYGGGIFVSSYNDFALRGKIIVADNTADGTRSNVYLNHFYVGLIDATAYLNGAPSADSWIGITSADIRSQRRKVGNDASYPVQAFFSDDPKYYLTYDEDGLWLEKGIRYNLTVNGEHLGSYSPGTSVSINGTSKDVTKAFKWWDGYRDVTFADVYSAITTIIMPSHDVELTASYIDTANAFTLTVDAPEAGKNLPTMGTISWVDSEGHRSSTQQDVIWIEKVGDNLQTVSGKAGYNKKYSVAAVLEQNAKRSIAFGKDVTAAVYYGNGTENAIYQSKLDESGALRIYGEQVSTDMARVLGYESITVSVALNSDAEALQKALPETVTLNTEDGEKILPLTCDAPDSVDLNTVGPNTVTMAIDYSDSELNPNNITTVDVTVNVVSNGVLQSPTASKQSGTYTKEDSDVSRDGDGSVRMTVSLENPNNADTNSGITYTLIRSCDSGSGITGEKVCEDESYTSSITLTAGHGERVTYILSATAAGSDDIAASSPATYTYVLDNPYTVTIRGIDTGEKTGTNGASELYTPRTYTYRKGCSVVIGAAAVEGELFERWADISGIEITEEQEDDMTLKVSPIQSDIELTAIYNPVITAIDITMDAPKTGDALPTSVKKISAVSSAYTKQSRDVTELFKPVTWSPLSGDTAAGGTVYTAVLEASSDEYASSGMKIRISENLNVKVTDSSGSTIAVTAAAQAEGNRLTLCISFPATEIIEPAADPKPEAPDVPHVPLEPSDDGDKSSTPFVDATEDDWFYDDVVYAYEEGLMQGTSPDHFSPYLSTTRGMVVTILYRLEGEPVVTKGNLFSDVTKGSYYEDAVTWAAENQIVNGYGDGKFGPDDCITREQLAAILYRYAQFDGRDVSVGEDTNILSYDDALRISGYAVSAMQWAVGSELIRGSDNKLTPAATATRSQLAAILHRYCE